MRIGIFILIGAVFFMAVMLMSTNLLQVILVEEPGLLIDPDDVSGSVVVYNDTPYTLGFGQQNLVIVMLNSMDEIDEPENFRTAKKLPFEELIIYHIDTPDDRVQGKEIEDGKVVFAFKTDSYMRYLLDSSHGEFLKVLKEAYQP